MERRYNDTDGKCFGSILNGKGCGPLVKKSSVCGTYLCPFYKPSECINWVRIDGESGVSLMPPEEYYGRYYQLYTNL